MPRQKKAKTRQQWKPFPDDMLRQVIGDLVHFSAKVINSNTLAGGVRLASNETIDLPYVSVRTLGVANMPLDYIKNTRKIPTIAKQVEAVMNRETRDIFDDVSDEEIARYEELLALADRHNELGLNEVGVRLRQIIVQDESGNDLSLTPLTSAGFGVILNKRLNQEALNTSDLGFSQRPRGLLDLGGSKPQNVGRHAHALRRPLWFTAPTINAEIRAATAIHFQGIRLTVPHELLRNFFTWRQTHLQLNGGVMHSTLKTRQYEENFVRSAVAHINQKASEARDILDRHIDLLPGQKLISTNLPIDMQAYLDPERRFSGWNKHLASRIHRGLLDQKFVENGEQKNIGVGQADSMSWLAVIREELQ